MNSLELVASTHHAVEGVFSEGDLAPFGEEQLAFASALSRELTNPRVARRHPELGALGFWLRKSNLQRVFDRLDLQTESCFHSPRGLAFHIAPSNVDSIFVYSWMISLLCGNRNIVRLSSRSTEQTAALIEIFRRLFSSGDWPDVSRRSVLVRYPHDEKITSYLSSHCDVRVIWGGDETINKIRATSIRPHATELAFANRFSLCVLNASAVSGLSEEDLRHLGRLFYNDAYWFGQMACSSPRLVVWIGDEATTQAAQSTFWREVSLQIDRGQHTFGPADFMNKFVAANRLAASASVKIISPDNRLTRVWLQHLGVHSEEHCGSGLFHESRIDSLDELTGIISRKIQTVSHFGITRNEIVNFIKGKMPSGIDRFVEVGKALDFGPIWDGHDLFRSFLRQIAY